MRFLPPVRRAALLGAAITVVSCDVASFVSDPKPILDETWSLPGPNTAVGVKDLLPANVTVLPDTSAFQLSIANVTIARTVGTDCAACVPLNGTSAVKPAFTMQVGNGSALPSNVVSAAIAGGTLSISLTNNMSFDPIYVNTNPSATTQGYLVVALTSCNVALGRDSVRGAATNVNAQNQPWAKNGGILTRNITFNTAAVNSTCSSGGQPGIRVDVTLNSPQGDHNETINSNGTLNASASVNNLLVSSVTVNVVNATMNARTDTLGLKNVDSTVIKHMRGGGFQLDITNPFAVSGNLNVQFKYGPGAGQTMTKTIALPSAGSATRFVTLDSIEIHNLVGKDVVLNTSGGVNSASAITVTPKQVVSIATRILATIRLGS